MQDELTQKLNQETAKIKWSELQRFFAAGNAIYVDAKLDLIATATLFAQNNTTELAPLTTTEQVKPMDDATAIDWLDNDKIVWAVVIAPWVLVQEVSE